jgi:hypothetical protein
MHGDRFIIIDSKNLPELAAALAPLLKQCLMKSDEDPVMTPEQLAEKLPVMSAYRIREQIRNNKYGQKIGTKGKLAAKVSEVKKYNRL